MIIKDIKFFGKHADILKKYSQNRNTSEEVIRSKYLSYGETKEIEEDLVVFETYFNGFMVSALLGLKQRKKVKVDQDSTKSATIFAEIIAKNTTSIKKLYTYYIFSEATKENINEKIKKAFSPIPSNEEMLHFSNEIIEYSCAGLEIIDDLLKKSHVIEDILISISEIIN